MANLKLKKGTPRFDACSSIWSDSFCEALGITSGKGLDDETQEQIAQILERALSLARPAEAEAEEQAEAEAEAEELKTFGPIAQIIHSQRVKADASKSLASRYFGAHNDR